MTQRCSYSRRMSVEYRLLTATTVFSKTPLLRATERGYQGVARLLLELAGTDSGAADTK